MDDLLKVVGNISGGVVIIESDGIPIAQTGRVGKASSAHADSSF
jgi:hypothetical protein